jgi:hypothetical protein
MKGSLKVAHTTTGSKTLLMDALNLKKPTRTPVAAHWWGVYKYEVTGRDAITAA